MALYAVVQWTTQGLPGKSINGEASSCSSVCATGKVSMVGWALMALNASTTSSGGSSRAEERFRYEIDPLICFSCNCPTLRHRKRDLNWLKFRKGWCNLVAHHF